MEKAGYFNLVLHAHLPYVLSHGKWPHGMDWIFEAAAETYIPLVTLSKKLGDAGYKHLFSIDISPVLAEQLADDEFKTGFMAYLDQKILAAEEDKKYFEKCEPYGVRLASFWNEHYEKIKEIFIKKLNRDLIAAFRELESNDIIEIFTCGATHGYFPLLSRDWHIQGQIATAIEVHKKYFGRKPEGIWLPECAYRPAYAWKIPVGPDYEKGAFHRDGIETFLSKSGLKYCVIDTHLLKGGETKGVYIDRFAALKYLWKQFATRYKPRKTLPNRSPYRLHYIFDPKKKDGSVAFFTRDPETGIQVWSSEHGYPGDSRYLDFHKKHFPGGHRYWKVTGAKIDLGDKQYYDATSAEEALEQHVDHFADLVEKVLLNYREQHQTPGILSAPFDAELFGHWWFEGPRFLEKLFYQLKTRDIQPVTCSVALKEMPPDDVVALPEGSWGQGGFHYIWMNDETKWTWEKIYYLEYRIDVILKDYFNSEKSDVILQRILKQILRELLLASASDWQFLISTWSARDYAELRFAEHAKNCFRLINIFESLLSGSNFSSEDQTFLELCETRDRLFGDIDPKWFLNR